VNTPAPFLAGVVEGFYGRPWDHRDRLAYAGLLRDWGLNCCIYAPKGDAYLRRRWRERWPREQWLELTELAARYAAHGLYWGVGLSPFALYQAYHAHARRQLREKIARLQELESPVLAVLFDDMPGGLDNLAGRQAEIVADICHWAPGVRVIACPTYYSFDPVLERHFGAMPLGYWGDLGRELPPGVDVFWTGNQVCSDAVQVADIEAISQHLGVGRGVVLWDNYPVNDGARRSRYLYTQPLAERPPALRAKLAGHLCNPMNQAVLSLPGLSGLAQLYASGVLDSVGLLKRVIGEATWEQLQRDGARFQQSGLDGMTAPEQARLVATYNRLPGQAAREVVGWLRGEYEFDPTCLTD